MIVLSAALVLVALALLLIGVIASDGVLLIWLSIAASVTAGLLLVVGVLQQRRAISAAARLPDAQPTGTPAAAATQPADDSALDRVAAHDSAPVVAVLPDDAPGPAVEPVGVDGESAAVTPAAAVTEPAAPAVPATPAVPGAVVAEPSVAPVATPEPVPAPAPEAAREAAPGPPAAGDRTPLSAAEVLVLPGRPRYHEASCRFLEGRDDIEGMTLDDAQAQGYTPCSVCRA